MSTAPKEFPIVVNVMAQIKGIRIHHTMIGVDQRHIPPNLSPSYPDPGSTLSGIRSDGHVEKSQLEHKQIFKFIGCQYDLIEGKVRPKFEQ